MILRKLADAITEQNWFTVVLEVLIVVVGIFIGLQVDDWNEGRKDRIDGKIFLERLHNDMLAAEQLSARVRDRRLDLIEELTEAANIIFDSEGQGELTDAQCFALSTSHYFNINISDLPSVTELMSVGRVAIIRNADLRTALVEFQLKAEALRTIISVQTPAAHNLPMDHPDLIASSPFFDEALGETQAHYRCDLAGMRVSQRFLNATSENVDGYDAYLRDGLVPWSDQLEKVHGFVDRALGIDHAN